MEATVGGIRVNRRKSLREEVYDSLRRSIIHGKLKGGQRLIEETLAHQVGISRTPVREAFHKLERDDLVMRLPKGGFAVRKFTRDDVEEIFGIRSALESYAAYLAAIHISPEKLDLLEKKVEESQKALENEDHDKVVQLHTEFHDLLYKASKSRKLVDMISNYSDYFYRYRPALIRTENGFRSSISDHQRMIEGMKRRNPRLVERLVRRHLERGKEIILKEIDQGKMSP